MVAGAVAGAADLPRSCRVGPDCFRFAETADAGGVPAAPDGVPAASGGLPGTEVRRVSCCAGLEPCRFGGDTPAGGGTALPGWRTEPADGFPAAPDCSLVRIKVCSTVLRSEWTFSRRVERVSVGCPCVLCPAGAALPEVAGFPELDVRCRTFFSPS